MFVKFNQHVREWQKRLFNIFVIGWMPPSEEDDPILLVKRAWSRQADALRNAALDTKQCWRKGWPLPSCYDADNHGVIAFSDGGFCDQALLNAQLQKHAVPVFDLNRNNSDCGHVFGGPWRWRARWLGGNFGA